MTITISFDIEQTSDNTDDRMRINLAFNRFGWEHIGGSSWRFPKLGAPACTIEDWFNKIIPALMYFRTIVSARAINVTKYCLDANSSAGFSEEMDWGFKILPAAELELNRSNLVSGTKLSESRLRSFFSDAEDSLKTK